MAKQGATAPRSHGIFLRALREKLAGAIQELQRANLAVLIAESDVKRLSFAETVYTIEQGAIVQA